MLSLFMIACFVITIGGLFVISMCLSNNKNDGAGVRLIGMAIATVMGILIAFCNLGMLTQNTMPYLMTVAWIASCILCTSLSLRNRESDRTRTKKTLFAILYGAIAAISTDCGIIRLVAPTEQALHITEITILTIPFFLLGMLIKNTINKKKIEIGKNGITEAFTSIASPGLYIMNLMSDFSGIEAIFFPELMDVVGILAIIMIIAPILAISAPILTTGGLGLAILYLRPEQEKLAARES